MAPTRAAPRPLANTHNQGFNNYECSASGAAPERPSPGAERASLQTEERRRPGAERALAAAVQGTYWAGTRDAFRTVTGAFRHAPGATSSRPDLEASRGLRKAANMMKLLATVLASPVAYLGLLEYEYHAQHSQRPEGRAAGAMGGNVDRNTKPRRRTRRGYRPPGEPCPRSVPG